MSWLSGGYGLPSALWEEVRAVAGCRDIAQDHCTPERIARIDLEVQSLPETLTKRAAVDRLFVARRLQFDGNDCDGIAYVMRNGSRSIGLDTSLFDNERLEPYLRVPRIRAILAEEIAHALDYALEAAGSPYFSLAADGTLGPKWRAVECDATGRPRPFPIPNRKPPYTKDGSRTNMITIEEDWASAVLWYLFRRSRFESLDPQRYAFVDDVFRHELHVL